MAAPQIHSVNVDPVVVPECGMATITINATDPDHQVITLTSTVTDQTGQSASVTNTLQISGPLTYGVTASAGTVMQDPAKPNVFIYQAPCPPDPNHDPNTHTNHTH